MKKSLLGIFFICQMVLLLLQAAAYSPLEEGEKLLREDKPEEARPLFEEALSANPQDERVYIYLGIVYEQLAQPEKSISIMQRGIEVAKTIKDILYYNIGNNFYRRGEKILAEEMYTKAIKQNSNFSEPYLNRANARLSQENFRGALNDYTIYLKLKPNTVQRPQIERMIALLTGLLGDQEKKETEKIAKEKALMKQVLDSLKNASADTQNLSLGADKILSEKEAEVDISE